MKRALIILQIIIFSMSLGITQIIYEGKYDINNKVFVLPDGSLKYYRLNDEAESLIIYSTDQTIWKTIDIDIPKGHLVDDINIINSSGTNNEAQLIILFTCYYESTNYAIEDVAEYFNKQIFTVNVIDEDGKYLLKVPEANGYKLLSNEGVRKLLVYKSESKGFKSKSKVEVYALKNK